MKKQDPVKFVRKNSKINIWKIKNIIKLEINVLIQEKIDVLRIAYVTYSVFQKVFIAFHKVTKIDKKEEEITNNISYILQFVDSSRFMESPLTYLVNSLFERIHKIKCKYEDNDKKCETCRSKYKYSECFFEYENFKDYLIECKCLYWYKSSLHKFDKKLKKLIFNTYKFSNHDHNETVLLLQKCVYPYKYMDDWEKLNETSIPKKEYFCIHFNMEDITDAVYAYVKKVCEIMMK